MDFMYNGLKRYITTATENDEVVNPIHDQSKYLKSKNENRPCPASPNARSKRKRERS
jgi:hypothetical protein